MPTAIGVLCARVRVEEKQLIAALADAGAVAMPLPPAALPLPPSPTLHDLAAMGSPTPVDVPAVIIDRTANRAIGRIMNRLLRHAGVRVIDGGFSSRRNRLEVANRWAIAGVPTPKTLVAFSQDTAVDAANTVGYPATVFPMNNASAATALIDDDTADAVIEHRVVLGSPEEEIMLFQHGAPDAADIVRVHVVDGEPIAVDGEIPVTEVLDIAARAAQAVEAAWVAIDVALVDGRWVAWDTAPVADFRKSTLLSDTTVAEAVARVAIAEQAAYDREVRDVVAVTV